MDRQSADDRYRFADFVLDARERRLDGPRGELHLRPKTFDLLVYLVQHEGHLVTRQDLLDAVWAGAGITENSLSQCVRELREVLADDPRESRFIQTVQRGGYRFVAPVERPAPRAEIPEFEEEIAAVRVVVEEGEEGSGVRPGLRAAGRRRRVVWWTLAACALFALVSFASWRWLTPTRLALVHRDWILVADFDDFARDPAVEAALRVQLERELSVSRLVNVVPRGRITDTLALMRRTPDTRLTEAVAREVCLRDGGVRAMVTGSIQEIGGRFAIAANLVEPATGTRVASFTAMARERGELLGAIHAVAVDVRRELAKALAVTPEAERSPEAVTTSSLEALTLYSKGLERMDAFEWPRAEALFDQAVSADPEFALGYFFRGCGRLVRGQHARGDFERAVALAPTVTSRERSFIEAVTAERAKAIDRIEAFLDRYPDDYWGHELVSWRYFQAGDHERWKAHQAECRRLRPNFAQPRFHAGWVGLLVDGDAEKAQQMFASVLSLNPRFPSPTVQCGRAFALWMQGKMPEAAAEFADFRNRRIGWLSADSQLGVRPVLARFYVFAGMPAEALALLETSRGMTSPRPDSEVAARFRAERAFVSEDLGRAAEAEALLAAAARERIGVDRVETLGWLAISRARRGERSGAIALGHELAGESRQPPPGFWTPLLPAELERAKRAFASQVDGEILLSTERPREALTRFEEVLAIAPSRHALFGTQLTPRVWLAAARGAAAAHAQLGDWPAAVAAYRQIVDRKALCIGTDGASGIWVSALGSLADALARTGQAEEAARRLAEYRSLRPSR